ncbi:MAG: chromosomal replication initiator protein DnaA [Deltaproteobacteria bacterium]|jgi:chromosomal replication initiator protein|nr:chromosomal replication initiator protein DnaA [Deltaproteobacteria bacterium]
MNNRIVNGGGLSQKLDKAWSNVVSSLSGKLPGDTFRTWIKPLKINYLFPDRMEIVAPNEYFLKYVMGHYKNDIEESLASECKSCGIEQVKTSYTSLGETNSLGLGVNGPEDNGLWLPPQQNPLAAMNQHGKPSQGLFNLNPNFTFENFVVGNPNSFAYSVAKAFSQNDNLGNNIVYILSDHGLGKSHLAQAMAQALQTQEPRLNIIYLTAEDFTNGMTNAINNSSMEDFKERFRQRCDVLMLDNITFLGGKGMIQQEVSYTMDHLLDKGKRVVLTSTYEPRSIPKLSQSLKSRFCSSLVANIEPPDLAMRVKILANKAKKEGLRLSDKVLDVIASNITSDVRQLEASVTTLAAKSRHLQKAPDVAMARECLSTINNNREDGLTLNRVLKFVCNAFRVEPQAVTSGVRNKRVAEARTMGIYLSRVLTGKTLLEIGKTFGRGHSSVLYAINKMEQKMLADNRVQLQVDYFIGQLNNQA